jgi:tetratricopeptide (TPR) repeat protein
LQRGTRDDNCVIPSPFFHAAEDPAATGAVVSSRRQAPATSRSTKALPHDSAQIRARIRRYERALAKEKRQYGAYDDGAGKRHLIGPLYLLMGDLDGALRSFAWFEREFPDDSGDAGQFLCWALALRRSGDSDGASGKLRQCRSSTPTTIRRICRVRDHA